MMNEEWRNELITKGAAFDALKGLEFCHYMEIGEDTKEVRLIRAEKVQDALQNLPPVQPEKRTEKRTETHARDLIDRQAAIDALCKAGCDSGYCGVSCDDVKAIEQLPPAEKTQLSEESTTNLQQTCNKLATDCISRQAAIDALIDDLSYYGSGDERAFGMSRAIGIVEKLPSAQPKKVYVAEIKIDGDEMQKCVDKAVNRILYDAYQPLTEEDYTSLRERFGAEVEKTVREMLEGNANRWMI